MIVSNVIIIKIINRQSLKIAFFCLSDLYLSMYNGCKVRFDLFLKPIVLNFLMDRGDVVDPLDCGDL